MKQTFTISGKSILELREQYGLGSVGFYNQSWYLTEAFAKDRPDAGLYEIDFGEETKYKTFGEQCQGLEKGFEVAHPAVIIEAVLQHYAKTKEYLLHDYWIRTPLLASDGYRVSVGYFDSGSLLVSNDWYDYRSGLVAVASSRKSKKSLDPRMLDPLGSSSLDLRVARLEGAWEKKFNEKLT